MNLKTSLEYKALTQQSEHNTQRLKEEWVQNERRKLYERGKRERMEIIINTIIMVGADDAIGGGDEIAKTEVNVEKDHEDV